MGSYKISTGMPQDAKLAVIAKRTKARRGEALALWVALLDHAAVAVPRGSIRGIDAEELAAALEFDPAAVTAVIDAFRERKMILPDDMLAGWSRSQKLSTPRTRAYRARMKAAVLAEESDEARRERMRREMKKRRTQL